MTARVAVADVVALLAARGLPEAEVAGLVAALRGQSRQAGAERRTAVSKAARDACIRGLGATLPAGWSVTARAERVSTLMAAAARGEDVGSDARAILARFPQIDLQHSRPHGRTCRRVLGGQ